MLKIAAIIGGVLLMAGVALAGTMTGLDSSNSPTIGQTAQLPLIATTQQEDRGLEQEQRGRQNEPGEDLRGPCDEPEHANDARCTGAPAPGTDDNAADDRGHDSSGPGPNSGPSDRSGHDGGPEDGSGHGGGNDD
jgi:hypothetical protein